MRGWTVHDHAGTTLGAVTAITVEAAVDAARAAGLIDPGPAHLEFSTRSEGFDRDSVVIRHIIHGNCESQIVEVEGVNPAVTAVAIDQAAGALADAERAAAEARQALQRAADALASAPACRKEAAALRDLAATFNVGEPLDTISEAMLEARRSVEHKLA